MVQQSAAVAPGQHQYQNHAAYDQWEPTTVGQLEHIGAPKCQVHHKEDRGRADAQPQRVFPCVANHIESQNGGDQHIGTHRNAVSRRQVARGFEHHHGQHDRHKQAPIHQRHVNLARFFFAGVQNLQTRQKAQLNHLLGHAKGAGDQGL